MTLTPADIAAQVFREKFKGYDQDEVDRFLDQVSDRIAELTKERDELRERVAAVEAAAAESIEAERMLKRTLVTAQRTADEAVAEARAQAGATTAEAQRRAAETVELAQRRAADIVADAERRAAETVLAARREADRAEDRAREERAAIARAVAEVQRFRAEYRDRVRAAIAEQLAVLDRAGELPDLPAGMAALAGADAAGEASPHASGGSVA